MCGSVQRTGIYLIKKYKINYNLKLYFNPIFTFQLKTMNLDTNQPNPLHPHFLALSQVVSIIAYNKNISSFGVVFFLKGYWYGTASLLASKLVIKWVKIKQLFE